MSKKKMPKRSVGGVYVHDMDAFLVETLRETEHYMLESIEEEKDVMSEEELQETHEKINTLRYFIQKTENKIKKNK